MDKAGYRLEIYGRVAVAHAVGLIAVGMLGTIGTTAGFSIFGGLLGLFLGGILSLPWLAVLFIIIWRYAPRLERHPVTFALVGPLIVSGSYMLIEGGFLNAVATSSAISGFCYLLLSYVRRDWVEGAAAARTLVPDSHNSPS